jgi:thiamine biosynthesis lipoprotein
MGMPITIDVRDDDVDPEAVDRAFAWLRHVDVVFSTYQPASDISRINRGEITVRRAHQDVAIVLDRCLDMRKRTAGYFDIEAAIRPEVAEATAQGRRSIDPSGLVKGWAVDRAAAILDERGGRNYAVNAGGDIRLRGGALPDTHWRIGIQHPRVPQTLRSRRRARTSAASTSRIRTPRGHQTESFPSQ